MPGDDVGTAFVRLGLSIDQHFTGYVDAYYGPDEIAPRDQGGGQDFTGRSCGTCRPPCRSSRH